jgi:hypothetical protein
VAFGLFLDKLNMPLSAIGAARGMLPKINLPHETLVAGVLLVPIGAVMIHIVLGSGTSSEVRQTYR